MFVAGVGKEMISSAEIENCKLLSRVSEASIAQLDYGELIKEDVTKATEYLAFYDWPSEVVNVWYGCGLPSKFSTFLIEITSPNKDVDKFMWVVVGDIPSAYLVTDDIKDPFTALFSYTLLMDEWVEAVKGGHPLDMVFPVNAPATTEWAEELDSRLQFIRRYLNSVPDVPDDIKQAVANMQPLFF